MKSFFFKRVSINYIYFGLLFVVLSFIHCYHVGILEKGGASLKSYFALHVIAETFLETSFLILLVDIAKSYFPKVFTYFFIALTFILFLAHLLEFPLVRIMDFSFWYALGFVTQESYQNLIEMLYASHISLAGWILGILFALFFLSLGLLFYSYSEKISAKKPLSMPGYALVICCLLTPCLLNFSDHIAIEISGPAVYAQYQKTLPCKDLFFSCHREMVQLPGTLKKPKSQEEVAQLIVSNDFKLDRRPNIYLFVIESLREDFLTSEIAPHLAQFKQENLSTDLSFSSANGTQISWFSLFYSKFPFYFNVINSSNWHLGSPALQVLKKMGYKIEVFSSVRLAYYQMQDLLFGKEGKLSDAYYLFPSDDEIAAHICDQNTISKLIEKMQGDSDEGGKCFVIFLESTHFGYSWPVNDKPLFGPVMNSINYFSIALSKQNLEKVKNRYRNAVYYIDSLFGTFMQTLKNSKNAEESIVVVTGDHGEEFYEEGHLFHASNLSHPQTGVPIYYKLGNNRDLPGKVTKNSSHIDIFPTIFHYLLKNEEAYSALFDGQSIFNAQRWPYMVAGRYNASRSPYEFFIHDGSCKFIGQFANKKEIFNSEAIHILSIQNLADEHLPYSVETVQTTFGPALERLFSP